MSTALTAEKAFQEKMVERVRSAVGELIPDAALSKLIDESIRKVFFDKRVRGTDWQGRVEYEAYSWFEQFIRSELEKKVSEAVTAWVLENSTTVKKQIEEIVAGGAGMAVVNAMNRLLHEPLQEFQRRVAEKLGMQIDNY